MNKEYRVVQVPPNRIARNWFSIWHYIQQIIPDEGDEFTGGNIQSALLAGDMNLFYLVDVPEDKNFRVLSMFLLRHGGDPVVKRPVMILYGLVAVAGMTMDAYRYGIDWLREFSKSKACTSISMQTRSEKVAQMARLLDAEVWYQANWRIE